MCGRISEVYAAAGRCRELSERIRLSDIQARQLRDFLAIPRPDRTILGYGDSRKVSNKKPPDGEKVP
jgi:hypothetical protein